MRDRRVIIPPRRVSGFWQEILRAIPALGPDQAIWVRKGRWKKAAMQKALHGHVARNPELIGGPNMRLRTQMEDDGWLRVWADRLHP